MDDESEIDAILAGNDDRVRDGNPRRVRSRRERRRELIPAGGQVLLEAGLCSADASLSTPCDFVRETMNFHHDYTGYISTEFSI